MPALRALSVIRDISEVFVDALFPRDCAACTKPLAGPGPFCLACAELTIDIDPRHCPICGLPGAQDANNCPDCLGLKQQKNNPADQYMTFTRARALYVYGAVVEQALHRCKFSGAAHIAPMTGQRMARAIADKQVDIDLDFDALVPVPVGRQRLRTRGFDQAVLMAQAIAQKLQRRLLPHALRRQRETAPQAQQNRQNRRDNMHNAFICAQPKQVQNKKILLIDDVMTTGMTAQAAAQALLAAGARQVEVFTFARAVLEHAHTNIDAHADQRVPQ